MPRELVHQHQQPATKVRKENTSSLQRRAIVGMQKPQEKTNVMASQLDGHKMNPQHSFLNTPLLIEQMTENPHKGNMSFQLMSVIQRAEAAEETAAEENTEDYYVGGNYEQPRIPKSEYDEMKKNIEQYMSVDLAGRDATIEELTVMGTGYAKFEEQVNKLIKRKELGLKFFFTKYKTRTKQPELAAGYDLMGIFQYVKKQTGQVCNQSVGAAFLEILNQFQQPSID